MSDFWPQDYTRQFYDYFRRRKPYEDPYVGFHKPYEDPYVGFHKRDGVVDAAAGVGDKLARWMRSIAQSTEAETGYDWQDFYDPVGVPQVPDMSSEAWKIVKAAIARQKAVNAKARAEAERNYRAMLAQHGQTRDASKQDITRKAEEDRARLNNMLSSRGISVGEKAAMNFGRFDEAVQDKIAEAIARYQLAVQDAEGQYRGRLAELAEQDRLLDAGAEAQALALKHDLEDRAFERAMAQAELVMNDASARANAMQMARMAQEASQRMQREEQEARAALAAMPTPEERALNMLTSWVVSGRKGMTADEMAASLRQLYPTVDLDEPDYLRLLYGAKWRSHLPGASQPLPWYKSFWRWLTSANPDGSTAPEFEYIH